MGARWMQFRSSESRDGRYGIAGGRDPWRRVALPVWPGWVTFSVCSWDGDRGREGDRGQEDKTVKEGGSMVQRRSFEGEINTSHVR